MKLQKRQFQETLDFFSGLRLLTQAEVAEVLSMFEESYPFASAMSQADSVHLHVKVASVSAMPHDKILSRGVPAENARDGYIKYPFPGGINLIFSSINIAQDDLLPDSYKMPKPFLDHVGIDLRMETAGVKACFDSVPATGRSSQWRHVQQGGEGVPVYCCHIQVAAKHWVYPPAGARWTRPVELAYGPLKISTDGKFGCDLRPIDPAHPQAAQAALCAMPPKPTSVAAQYYDSRDLPSFGELGKFAAPAMEKFLDYFVASTGSDGALSRREKALIALAVAHSRHCPYSIDTFSAQALESGATLEQMYEALHVAAGTGTLADLAHGLQLRNALKAKGAGPV